MASNSLGLDQKTWKVEIKNLRQMRVAFTDIGKAINAHDTRSNAYREASARITKVFRRAADVIRDTARANAASGGVPKRIYTGSRPAIFAFSDFDAGRDDKRSRSSLVGVRTGLARSTYDPHLFVNWHPGSGRRNKDQSALSKGGLSISFARLYESGTRRAGIRPRHYFFHAIQSSAPRVFTMIADAYKSAVEEFNAHPVK